MAETVVHMDKMADRSADGPLAMENGNSRSEMQQQQTLDLEMLAREIQEIIDNIKLKHDKKTDSFDICYIHERLKVNVLKEDLVLELGEQNVKAMRSIEDENWYGCLCELTKGAHFSNVL